MKIWKRKRFSPRSLRQLVQLAFLLVLLPLLILAYQAYQSLSYLSMQAAAVNRVTLEDAQRTEIMDSLALEIERSYRQYCVLGDISLKKFYGEQRTQYAGLLKSHATVLSTSEDLQRIRQQFNALAYIRCERNEPTAHANMLLTEFANSNDALHRLTRELMSARGAKLQQAIALRGQFFGWQALILFVASFVLMVLFTKMIIGPVKGILEMINTLGSGSSLVEHQGLKGPEELREVAKRILWLSERLSWLESQRHEFLRHISHELKTPLASLREGTDILADEVAGKLNTEQKGVVTILDNSSRHLQRLIEQLLDYNRQLSDIPLNPQQLVISDVITEIIEAHQLPAKAKEMQTILRLSETELFSEPVLLARALDNLYSNAVHYGKEQGTIVLATQVKSQQFIIDVKNDGAAIAEHEQKMIFEPFYQGSAQRKGAVKGSGLGLSIAQDCIQRLGGTLQLSSAEEGDVCFRILLPHQLNEPRIDSAKNHDNAAITSPWER